MTQTLLRIFVLTCAAWMTGAAAGSACSIPVFRFALERWESDRFQVIVYHEGALSAKEEQTVAEWELNSVVRGGPLNIEVIRYDVTSASPPKMLDAEPPSDQSFPHLEVRGRDRGLRWTRQWQGSLADAVPDNRLFDSPARQEIVRRILAGNSVVWLLVAPDEKQAEQQSESLQQLLEQAAREIALPEGIGLPGSELFAPVPLEIRFSVVATHHAAETERPFLRFLSNHTQEWRTDLSYVVPIFGRGRAIEVIPYAELDAELIGEIGGFLCGACSCQVKQANPGFDLLLAVNWEEKLLGAPPSADDTVNDSAKSNGDTPEEPQYVPIPKGVEPETGSMKNLADETTSVAVGPPEPNVITDDPAIRQYSLAPVSSGRWITVAGTTLLAACVIVIFLTAFFRAR